MGSRKLYDADQRASSFVTKPKVLLVAGAPSVSVVVHQGTRCQAERVAEQDHFDEAAGPLARDLEWLGGAESCCPREPDMAARGQRGHAAAAVPPRRPDRVTYLIVMRAPRRHICSPVPRSL